MGPLGGQGDGARWGRGNLGQRSDPFFGHPSGFCPLARFGGGVTSLFPADRLPLLEPAGFSEQILLASFPGWVSLLPLFALVCPPFPQFGCLCRTSLPGSV